jgi:hypothetical protein
MIRPILNIVMVVLLVLQGMTLAAADVMPQADDMQSMEHCAGHEKSGSECACCGDSEMMGINCAAQCSVAVSIPTTLLTFAVERDVNHPRPAASWMSGPSYSPLNPPPIA